MKGKGFWKKVELSQGPSLYFSFTHMRGSLSLSREVDEDFFQDYFLPPARRLFKNDGVASRPLNEKKFFLSKNGL